MLKSLIWGSNAPAWEEEEKDEEQQEQQSQESFPLTQQDPFPLTQQDPFPLTQQDAQASQVSINGATAKKTFRERRATPTITDHRPQPSAKLRARYIINRGGPRAGPLSVNDPELMSSPRTAALPLSDGFFGVPPPLGPAGTSNSWCIDSTDVVTHVHRLLRLMMAGQDYAGAARALAVLHRLHGGFDPDVYRHTLALLRLAGDHTKSMMYLRKVTGVMSRTPARKQSFRGSSIVHDYLAYLADTQEYKEALIVCQNLQQIEGKGGRSAPMLRAHIAILHLFIALLEHQQNSTSSSSTPSSATPSTRKTRKRSRTESVTPSSPTPRSCIPDLQDPLALITPLRACWKECSRSNGSSKAGNDRAGGGRGDSSHQNSDDVDDSWRTRALGHLNEAKKSAELGAEGSPGNASAAGYRAALEAAEFGSVAGLRRLEAFVERNPGSIKGRALYVRLLEMTLRDARSRSAVKQEAADREGLRLDAESKVIRSTGGAKAAEKTSELQLAEVWRARALRGWLEADPLEPRAALDLASFHARRFSSGASVGVANEQFIANALVSQIETYGHTHVCPRPPQRVEPTASCDESTAATSANEFGDLSAPPEELHGLPHNTTPAALALWQALADLLGSLRSRDTHVPLVTTPKGQEGGKLQQAAAAAAAPPRPGTVWDRLYGRDPPWGPTDFQRCRGDGVGDRRRMVNGLGDGVPQGLPDGTIPHPLLRGVDQEMWEDTMLDPSADPLLMQAAGGRPRVVGRERDEPWCSDDEDCIFNSDSNDITGLKADEQTALIITERSRLASVRDGGCVYYLPPTSAEEEMQSWATDNDQPHDPVVGGAGDRIREIAADLEARSSMLGVEARNGTDSGSTANPTNQLQDVRDDGLTEHRKAGRQEATMDGKEPENESPPKQEEGTASRDFGEDGGNRGHCGVREAGAGNRWGEEGGRVGRTSKVAIKGEDFLYSEREQREDEDGSSEGIGNVGRIEKGKKTLSKRYAAAGDHQSPNTKRHKLFVAPVDGDEKDEDDDDDTDIVVHSKTIVRGVDWMEEVRESSQVRSDTNEAREKHEIVDHESSSEEEEEEEEEGRKEGLENDQRQDDGDGALERLREEDVPLGPPVGADAEATRLAKIIVVKMPSEEAVWLLTNKCCVAAHIFGPQHSYCLRAIGRLCRSDVRDIARPARETLRRRGFRLQLSLARLAAENVRAAVASEGYKGVGWGLPTRIREGEAQVQPHDSYIPEFIKP